MTVLTKERELSTKSMFQVSVVIPVYNAAKFVEHAVDSALAQPETAEVLLIEDGSRDDSLVVCKTLAEKHDKVRLLQHPNGKNRGVSASRNLGMKNTQHEFITYLDADDYYLPGRFFAARKVFVSDPDCDGVYEAIGIHFEDENAKNRWLASPMANVRITTMSKRIDPDKLFKARVDGRFGHFSLDGLTIKRSLLNKSGYMNENINMHEDTEFIFRLIAVGKLLPGRLEKPVTIRRVHGHNVISAPRSPQKVYKDVVKMWKSTYWWLHKKRLNEKRQLVLEKLLNYCTWAKPLPFKWMNTLPYEFKQIAGLILFPFDFPYVILKKKYWNSLFAVPVGAVFKRNIERLKKYCEDLIHH